MFTRFKIILIVKVFVILFFLFVLIGWLILPGQLKSYVEKNDKKWIEREISIQKTTINPFTFEVNVNKVIIKEPNNKDIFISFDNLLIDFDFWTLFQSKINAREIKLTNLFANIKQNGTQFNFSDLLKREKTKSNEEASEPLAFHLKNIQVLNSKINYIDEELGSKIVLDSVNIKDQSFSSKDHSFDAEISIHQPQGGWIKGFVSYHLKNNDYRLDTQVEKWQLAPFKSYVTSVIRLNTFEGHLDFDLEFSGNTNTDFIKTNGEITVSDFKITDPENKPLVSIGKFFVAIKEIDSKTNVYDFKGVLIDDSKITFEYLPNGDNFTKLLEDNSVSNTKDKTSEYYVSPFEMLSLYIYDMTKEYIFKSYTAEKIAFTNFNLKFYDYTLEDPFHMDLEKITIKSEDIKPGNEFAKFDVNGKINSKGVLDGSILVSRQGVENMTVDMSVKGLFLTRFSPYSRMYTAHRFEEGISSFTNSSVIKDSYLTSTNKLHIESIKVSKKEKTRNGSSLPMRLAVALMKDSKGNIDLNIPIEGPINDPEYKYGKVIWQVVKNIFTKAVTSPVKSLVNTLKTDEKDLKNIYFDNGQVGLSPKQKKSLNTIISVLNKKSELVIDFNHLYNREYELDAIGLKSAKLLYLKQSDIKRDKNIPIGKQAFDLANSDPDFLIFLEKTTNNYDRTISVSENARRLIGGDVLKAKLEKVIIKQKKLLKNYLIKDKGVSENRFKINDASKTEEAINQSRPKFEVKFGVIE